MRLWGKVASWLSTRPCSGTTQHQHFTTSLKHSLSRNYGLIVGQVLVTKQDFINDDTRGQLFNTLREMLALNIIPIINTNDAVSPPPAETTAPGVLNITDNDSLASRVAVDVGADLAILMSDVDGIYDRPPKEDGANLLPYYNPNRAQNIQFGAKSDYGTGGMESKVQSACYALDHGCTVIICNGMKYNTIRNIMAAQNIGTMFTPLEITGANVEGLAKNARQGSRRMVSLLPEQRADIIRWVGHYGKSKTILVIMHHWQASGWKSSDQRTGNLGGQRERPGCSAGSWPHRSHVRPSGSDQGKAGGPRQGTQPDRRQQHNQRWQSCQVWNLYTHSVFIDCNNRRTKISSSLEVVQKTVPIGVLMVIFESRPDALPQVIEFQFLLNVLIPRWLLLQ